MVVDMNTKSLIRLTESGIRLRHGKGTRRLLRECGHEQTTIRQSNAGHHGALSLVCTTGFSAGRYRFRVCPFAAADGSGCTDVVVSLDARTSPVIRPRCACINDADSRWRSWCFSTDCAGPIRCVNSLGVAPNIREMDGHIFSARHRNRLSISSPLPGMQGTGPIACCCMRCFNNCDARSGSHKAGLSESCDAVGKRGAPGAQLPVDASRSQEAGTANTCGMRRTGSRADSKRAWSAALRQRAIVAAISGPLHGGCVYSRPAGNVGPINVRADRFTPYYAARLPIDCKRDPCAKQLAGRYSLAHVANRGAAPLGKSNLFGPGEAVQVSTKSFHKPQAYQIVSVPTIYQSVFYQSVYFNLPSWRHVYPSR